MKKLFKLLSLGFVTVFSLGVVSSCSLASKLPWGSSSSESSSSQESSSSGGSSEKDPYVPGPAPEETEFVPTFRFVVASDMHVSASGTDSTMTKDRFKDMFTQMNAYADAQTYSNIDAVLLAGDVTDYGTQSDLATVQKIINENMAEESELVITMGNHDFWGNKSNPTAMIQQFEDYFGDVNSHKEIGGYHFITLCASGLRAGDPGWTYTDDVIEYARTELAKAYEEVGADEPIFVVQHVGNTNTCVGTCEHVSSKSGNAVDSLNDVFKQYPNVVSFAGHSHFTSNDECAIHQKDYTSIATGGLYYSTRILLNDAYLDMDNKYEMAQNYVVEMDANNVMRVRCWDILQQKFVGETWTISSWEKQDFIYTEDRFFDGDLFFADGATITVNETGMYGATISFNPVPQESVTARVYKVLVKDENGKVVVENYISKDYFNESSAPIETEIKGLRADTTYTVEVIALNSLYCSELSEEEWIQKSCSALLKSAPLTTTLTTLPKENPDVITQSNIINFDDESDLENFYVDSKSTATWVSSHGYTKVASDGGDDDIPVNGVVKVEYQGTTSPWFSFKPAQLMENYQEYDYIVFHMMFIPGDNQINVMKPGAGSNCEWTGNGDGKTCWTYTYERYFCVYAFDISAFLDTWTDGDIDTATAKVQLTAKAAGAGTYYIANIYAAKGISGANLDVTINGEARKDASVKAGDVISLEAYNPEQYPYIKMTVKGPNGQVITDLTSITAQKGTYTITFEHDVMGATSDDVNYYFLRHDYGGCYSRVRDKVKETKTVTFTVE